MGNDKQALSVSQLARKMRNLLEIQIGECWVEGEISNLRKQSSGHQYFTLKDNQAQLSCAFFKGRAARCKIELQDGLKVRLFAEVSLYEARGSLQLVVVKAEPVGQGELQARFEALKARLAAEGLFDAARKQAMPSFPRDLAVVTSPTGAAIQDMLNVLRRRAPWVRIHLFPVRVQGAGAELEIARAINELSQPEAFGHPRADLIIIGRGGGSLEDLWNFNEEVVARAIAHCPIPLISAVGHEIDFTISDFAADLRAPTPSAAAELAVPDGAELKRRLDALKDGLARRSRQRIEREHLRLDRLSGLGMERTLERAMNQRQQRVEQQTQALDRHQEDRLRRLRERLQGLAMRLKARHPERWQEKQAEKLVQLSHQLNQATQQALSQTRERLKRLSSLLRTLGPEQTLARGYSITFDEEGRILRSAQQVSEGQLLRTRTVAGEVISRVENEEV